MKINPIRPQNAVSAYKVRNGAQAPKGATKQLYDNIDISENSRTFASAFNAIRGQMNEVSAEQAERINVITEQIKNGTYHVSGRDVAEKMISGIAAQK